MTQKQQKQHKQRGRLLAAGFVLVCLLAALIARADVHPSGGVLERSWHPGSTVRVSWTSDDVRSTAQILLLNVDTGAMFELARGIEAGAGSFNVKLPQQLPRGDHYRLAIREDGPLGRTTFAHGYHSIAPPFGKTSTQQTIHETQQPTMYMGPNPASNSTHIGWTDARTRVVVRRLTGEEIYAQDVEANIRSADIDVRHFGSGVYSIELIAAYGERLRSLLLVQ